MVIFKIIWAFIPFVREMFFPGKTNAQVLSQNKLAISLLLLLGLSFAFNWIMIERIYLIALERRTATPVQMASRAAGAASAASSVGHYPGMNTETSAASEPQRETSNEAEERTREEIRARLNDLFGK